MLIFFAWFLSFIVLYCVYGMHNSELAKGRDVMAGRRDALLPGMRRARVTGEPTSSRSQ